MSRRPHKFDPARAEQLERPERQEFLPNERVLDLLELRGGETVVDYGAGTGTLTIPLARRVPRGVVHAVDESPEMVERLRERVEKAPLRNVRTHLVEENRVPLESGVADRILAVNLLHEVVGETALAEMRRLLAPDGLLLCVDWRSDVERETGPPREVSLTPEEGRSMLEEAGFSAEPAEGFPYHFTLLARPVVGVTAGP
ncbi:MAG: class I SAM-dependent methyltransferase [Rubrobacter sp.]|nr:class I SAM-dependent methyltransferase [Rubrobacter sp.]